MTLSSPLFFCEIERGDQATIDASTYGAVSLLNTGFLLAVSLVSSKKGLGSQVAIRLAREKFFEHFFSLLPIYSQSKEPFDGPAILEAVVHKVNESIYRFGHQLAAGGKCSTNLIAMLIESNRASVVRVGIGQTFIIRKGRAYPFFDSRRKNNDSGGTPSLLGAHSEVAVEVSSVALHAGDGVVGYQNEIDIKEDVLALFLDTFGPSWHHSFPLSGLVPHLVENKNRLPFCILVRC